MRHTRFCRVLFLQIQTQLTASREPLLTEFSLYENLVIYQSAVHKEEWSTVADQIACSCMSGMQEP